MKRFLFALAFLFAYSAAFAQSPPIDSYRLNFYPGAATAPSMGHTLNAADVQCNQPARAVPPGVPTNPRVVAWTDPAAAGRDCVWTDPGTGPLFALPFGQYTATLTPMNAEGPGPESDRSNPFMRLTRPTTVVTGVRLLPPGS